MHETTAFARAFDERRPVLISGVCKECGEKFLLATKDAVAETYLVLVKRFSVADDVQSFARPSQRNVHSTRVCEKSNAASFCPHRRDDNDVLLTPLVSA